MPADPLREGRMPAAIPALLSLGICALVSSVLFPLPAAAAACDLRLSAASPGQQSPGGSITYAFSLRNNGTGDCVDASLSVYYGNGETFSSAAPAPSVRTNYYWRLGRIASGSAAQVSVVTSVGALPAGARIENEACATATNGSDSCTYVVTTISGSAPPPPPPPPPSVPPASSGEFGAWIWKSPYALSPAAARQYVDAAASYGFTVLYVTMDDYLDLYDMPEGPAKRDAIARYVDALYSFIAYSHSRHIGVAAAAGEASWGTPAERYRAYALLDFIAAFNAAHDGKVRRIQYDIEPHLVPGYEQNKAAVLTDYVGLVYGLAERGAASSVRIGMDVPHFFDASMRSATPFVTFRGKNAAVFTHVLDALDIREDNSVDVMAYRNFAHGAGGSIDLSEEEIAEAAGHRTKVILSQEVGNVQPPHITFYGKPKSALFAELDKIREAFSGSSGFAGLAIHHLDPFLALRD